MVKDKQDIQHTIQLLLTDTIHAKTEHNHMLRRSSNIIDGGDKNSSINNNSSSNNGGGESRNSVIISGNNSGADSNNSSNNLAEKKDVDISKDNHHPIISTITTSRGMKEDANSNKEGKPSSHLMLY